MDEVVLWERVLSCGHSRSTDVSYALGVSDEPCIGDTCYCRICHKNSEIIDVERVD